MKNEDLQELDDNNFSSDRDKETENNPSDAESNNEQNNGVGLFKCKCGRQDLTELGWYLYITPH